MYYTADMYENGREIANLQQLKEFPQGGGRIDGGFIA
jgi:hypothetical protein